MFTLNSGITHLENTFVLWLHGKVFVVLSCYCFFTSCFGSLDSGTTIDRQNNLKE